MFNRSRKGFTLIELLVVVSIIALLVSILMPALGKAKEQARKVVCAGNEHQLGLVFATYAADYGKYPHRVQYEHWPFGGHVWRESSSSPKLPASFSMLFEAEYLDFAEKSYRFLYCPSNRAFTYEKYFLRYQTDPTINPDWPNGLYYQSLYTAYCYWGGFPDFGPNANPRIDERLSKALVTKCNDSSGLILASDMTITDYAFGDDHSESYKMDNGWTSHITNGEIQGGNSLYNDGSVQWLSMREMQNDWEKHVWKWNSQKDIWF